MKITKYNKMIASTWTITTTDVSSAYTTLNMRSGVLVEATLIDSDVIADFGSAVTGSNVIVV